MPHCAVNSCHNQSKRVNKQNSGVTYHRFPNDPCIKDKWIYATGKTNWIPKMHDTICSDHFEVTSFLNRSNARLHLASDAIPTLKLEPELNKMNLVKNYENVYDPATAPAKRRKIAGVNSYTESVPSQNSSQATPETDNNAPMPTLTLQPSIVYRIVGEGTYELENYALNVQDTPERRKLKLSYMRSQETIKRQRLTIKRLRESNRRLKKKFANIWDIIVSLGKESDLTDEDITSAC